MPRLWLTAMKATGWEFASHTWGHINVGQKSLEGIQTDTEKWLNYVSPLVGGTDVIIFRLRCGSGRLDRLYHRQ